ncbi:MAG TPA: hypothetical protein VEY69_05620 [Lautropia sp.]|nr:hypothetical protein [Lautropia sp.]
MRIEQSADHALSPAKGVVTGLTISILLWAGAAGLLAFILY